MMPMLDVMDLAHFPSLAIRMKGVHITSGASPKKIFNVASIWGASIKCTWKPSRRVSPTYMKQKGSV